MRARRLANVSSTSVICSGGMAAIQRRTRPAGHEQDLLTAPDPGGSSVCPVAPDLAHDLEPAVGVGAEVLLQVGDEPADHVVGGVDRDVLVEPEAAERDDAP